VKKGKGKGWVSGEEGRGQEKEGKENGLTSLKVQLSNFLATIAVLLAQIRK
jgi:hypothetical protein